MRETKSSIDRPRTQHNQSNFNDVEVELSNLWEGHVRLLSEAEGNLLRAEEVANLLSDTGTALHENCRDFLLKWQERYGRSSVSDGSVFAIGQPQSDNILSLMLRQWQHSPHAAQLSYLSNQGLIAEHLRFCHTVAEIFQPQFSPLVSELFGATEPLPDDAISRVVYQKNIYTDEAFLRFAREIPDIKAHYADSFQAVCEQVSAGQTEYCILPLENSQDGKLARFYSLIERYELKILLTCEIPTADNRHITVFGLCARQLSMLFPLEPNHPTCFEFVFWQNTDQLSLGELISAAEQCSFHLIRMDGLPPSDDEILMGAGYAFDLSFAVPLSPSPLSPLTDLFTLMLFLYSRAPTALPLGIYRQL